MTRKSHSLDVYLPKVLVIGVDAPYNKTKNIESYFAEFLNLVATNGIEYNEILFVKLREIESATFFTKGKLEEISKICEEKNIEEVIISEPLTPLQERNLNDVLNATVFDRTRLILEIFEKAALTSEGKAQVAVAMLRHKKSRLAGKGIHMSQQSGVIGGRGLGETAKERESRHIENQILKLRRDVEKFQQSRTTQRKQRISRNVPMLCLIGYTNAGKSSLLNALTKSDVLAEDRPFVTLDTTTRELYISNQKKGVISDTVGFIQMLPPQLIDAFKSTLSELQYADLLLEVVDLSDPNWESHIKVVSSILDDLDVKQEILYVFNKIDKVEDVEALTGALSKYLPHVLISTRSKKGLQPLMDFLGTWEKNESTALRLKKD